MIIVNCKYYNFVINRLHLCLKTPQKACTVVAITRLLLYMDGFGNRLRSLRNERGLTQSEVAEVARMAKSTYSMVESNERDISIGQALRLARLFRVSISDLLGEADSGNTVNVVSNIDVAAKYKEIILTVIDRASDRSNSELTRSKLMYILYLVDFVAFNERGRSVSGASYRKLNYGPVADIFFRALDELECDGVIARSECGRAIKYKLVEDSIPSDLLDGHDMMVVDGVASQWRDKSSSEIKNFIIHQRQWNICELGDVIPYTITKGADRKSRRNAIVHGYLNQHYDYGNID